MSRPEAPLLESKLHAPRRRGAIDRPRLRDRLEGADQPALTLVSAPAGFGKTTLVADWVGDEERTAWMSLDERDNDPAQFWTYVLAAIERVDPDLVGGARLALEVSPPDLEAVVTGLLNDLHGPGRDLVVVLDDYHVIESVPIHDSVAMLASHLPPRARLVIASRADPPLPLATLRAKGELLELRAADLRFTAEEATRYLNEAMGLELEASDIDALEERTEGWAAALQLAALSLQGRDDPTGFIAEFAGDDRFILDYLVGEVLDRQPDDVRRFLLHTCVLDRLTGALCDAVTGEAGGRAMLERLDRANLFLVPLDDRRSWYRYHHLFAEVLRARLLDEEPELLPTLHRRASDWFDQDGHPADAVAHSLLAGNHERAARLIELAAPALRRSRQEATLRRWLEALPSEVFTDRPVLAMGLVGARMATGDTTGVEELLDAIDAALAPTASPPVVADLEMHEQLPAQVAIQRAGLALLVGDLAATTAHAQRALELVAEGDHLRLGAASALLGLASWADGDLVSAEERYVESVRHLYDSGHVSDALGCTLALADIRLAGGHLGDAEATFEQGLRWIAEHPGLRGAADVHVGLAEVHLERNELEAAVEHLVAAADLGPGAGLPQNPYRSLVARALLSRAQGDLDGALSLLDEAEPLYDTDFSPPVRPVSAIRARVQIERGDLRAAQRWADSRGLHVDDQLTYVREYEHVTLARILLADRGATALAEATGLLERLLVAAEEGERQRSVAEITELLAAARDERSGAPPVSRSTELVDDLSARELDVLRLLRSELSGPDIASELYISLNTFRTHTKNIYAKLGVNNRREAVRRAEELGL